MGVDLVLPFAFGLDALTDSLDHRLSGAPVQCAASVSECLCETGAISWDSLPDRFIAWPGVLLLLFVVRLSPVFLQLFPDMELDGGGAGGLAFLGVSPTSRFSTSLISLRCSFCSGCH